MTNIIISGDVGLRPIITNTVDVEKGDNSAGNGVLSMVFLRFTACV